MRNGEDLPLKMTAVVFKFIYSIKKNLRFSNLKSTSVQIFRFYKRFVALLSMNAAVDRSRGYIPYTPFGVTRKAQCIWDVPSRPEQLH